MREIKYKAWVKTFSGAKMFEVESVWLLDGKAERVHTVDSCRFKNDEEPITLLQYTGLRDSTRTKEFPEGIEIYEGDILDVEEGYVFGSDHKEKALIGTVKFDDGGYDVLDVNNNGYELNSVNIHTYNMVVVGNMYENRELLYDRSS
jgi:uncharacterized phage protein (TIGR01671 family)